MGRTNGTPSELRSNASRLLTRPRCPRLPFPMVEDTVCLCVGLALSLKKGKTCVARCAGDFGQILVLKNGVPVVGSRGRHCR